MWHKLLWCAPAGLLTVLLPSTSYSDPTPESITRAANNAGHEMIECAAYFAIVREGFKQSPNEDSAKGAASYDKAMSGALAHALQYAELISQKPEAVEARFELAMDTMMEEMGRNYVNISILMNKYGKPCMEAMEDPAARLEYWMAKAEQ